MEKRFGPVTNDVAEGLHLSFQYLCCYNRTELARLESVMAAVRWEPIRVRFTRVICAGSMVLGLADPAAQGALFGIVSAIEEAMAGAGLWARIRVRAEQAPFHASLFNAEPGHTHNVSDVIELAQSTIVANGGLNAEPIVVDSFEFNGKTFHAVGAGSNTSSLSSWQHVQLKTDDDSGSDNAALRAMSQDTDKARGTAGVAVLDNTALPKDQHGLSLITGEASVLFTKGFWYFYFNNWVGGCACGWTCTRHAPPACNVKCSANMTDPLHTVVVYRTRDLVRWENLGVAFRQPDGAAGGELERPHVVLCAATGQFVLWWERSFAAGGTSYAVGTSKDPAGPFSMVNSHANTSNTQHDFNVFVDDDGTAFHISLKTFPCWNRPPQPMPPQWPARCSGLMIQKLSWDFLATDGSPIFLNISATGAATALEAPIMFKAYGWYYATAGTLSCAEAGGTTVFAFKSRQPMGQYVPASRMEPNNGCIAQKTDSRAQGSTTFSVGGDLIWLGNQWLTSQAPNRERNYDLLRFAKLNISAADGLIEPLRWEQNISVVVSGNTS